MLDRYSASDPAMRPVFSSELWRLKRLRAPRLVPPLLHVNYSGPVALPADGLHYVVRPSRWHISFTRCFKSSTESLASLTSGIAHAPSDNSKCFFQSGNASSSAKV